MKRFLLAVLISPSLMLLAFAQRPGCTSTQASKALDEADTPRTWDALYRSYTKYVACDDGAIAEGYSDSVSRILLDHWETLPRLVALSTSHPKFKKFVLQHVDLTAFDTERTKKLKSKATHSCPAGAEDICKELRYASEELLKEMR